MTDLTDYMGPYKAVVTAKECQLREIGLWVKSQGLYEYMRLKIRTCPVVAISGVTAVFTDKVAVYDLRGVDVRATYNGPGTNTFWACAIGRVTKKRSRGSPHFYYVVEPSEGTPDIVCFDLGEDGLLALAERHGFQLI